MSDPTPPRDAPDERDDRLAGLLAVEPLDELSRRRLVQTALDRTASPWRRRVLVAAAVVAVLGISGGVWLVAGTGRGGPHRTVAAPTTPTLAAGSSHAQVAAPAAAPPFDLGDFGNLADPTAVGRLRAAVASLAASPSRGAVIAPDLQAALAAARRCDPAAGPVTTVATGTLDGRDALVLVVGDRLIAVTTAPCGIRPLG